MLVFLTETEWNVTVTKTTNVASPIQWKTLHAQSNDQDAEIVRKPL
jgi:hypothetical protein